MRSSDSQDPAGEEVGADAPEPSGRPAFHRPTHRWGFGAFLFVEAVLLATAAFVGVFLGGGTPESVPVRDVLIGTMTPTMLAALSALVITKVRGNGPLADLCLAWRWDDVKVGLKFGALGLVCTVVGVLVWTRLVGEDNATSAIGALIEDKPMSVSAAVAMFVYLWLLGPVCEEIIYRGLLWGAAERLGWGSERWGRFAAFVLSTAVFAVSHLEPLRTSLLIVIAIPIGLARLVTGRLLGSIVAHQMNNFLPALAILLTSLGVVTS
ncbi:CPBP family intramembrane glutamic endopeptidase [Saccharomonospora glauca]|uniref:Putative metal-dependent membrane protease n=1 Tax=Saccharomonospora glauca K62 TaxID=928724 RepID=I1CZ72_9PSEU|nr:CPBP family intramembrane glutamic endopeptidase [Saccharomonospora glauca]EIE97996.1 putative metal-dependent membrane protease [Saccharomonospora glauca K62]